MSINKRIRATVIIHWLDRMNLSREGRAMRFDDDGRASRRSAAQQVGTPTGSGGEHSPHSPLMGWLGYAFYFT